MKPALVARAAFFVGLVFASRLVEPSIATPAFAANEETRSARSKPASGQFSANDLPADRDGDSLLTIPAPGRYAIRAKSPSGARIELIDMIAGPGEASGAPGLRDGRIDALLDKGVYKIRVSSAKGASGKVRLNAEPFVDVDGRKPLAAGHIASGDLGDMQQRAFVLEVGAAGRIGVEAAGRALQDLRLFSENGDLVDLTPGKTVVEPKAGHPMNRLLLEGAVAPGRYIVTAYGGEALVWPDGAGAKPFHIRRTSASMLAAGVAEGVIGPMGSVRFEAPVDTDSFRLELPQPVSAKLDVRRGSQRQFAFLDKTNREPVIVTRLPADGKQPALIEVTGFEGQSFSLRALRQESRRSFEGSGRYLVSVDIAGEGGDEPPATVLLARLEKEKSPRVLASDMPRLSAGRAWRGKFNLRGTTSLLFEATSAGPVAITVKGVKLRATIEPALGSLAARADGHDPLHYDLQPGFYLLSLEPLGDAAGVVDVTLGTPGLTAELAATPAPRTSLSFGEQQLEKDSSYLILTNVAPGLLTGPRVVPLPVELAKAPLALWQTGAELVVPVTLPKTGRIVARDARGAEVAVTLGNEKIDGETRLATIKIAPFAKPRALGLVFTEEPAKSEDEHGAVKTSRSSALNTAPERPVFFDLARDESKDVRFEAPQGGLYRIETLGRLQTSVKVGATLSPRLASAENNGPGHNGLVATFLRAGSYRASVTARESAGRVGIAVAPAPLVATSKIIGEGAARATLAAGAGAVIPIEIAREGLYRIDLLGVGREWRARLEDAEGWPLTIPGKLTKLTRRFEKGAYRLVVLPEDVEGRVLARLRPVVTPQALEGHGPHALPFDKTQKLQWREPAAKDAPRAPDVWRFSLAGDADAEISIGDGMIGEIFKGGTEAIGKLAGGRKFSGKLAAGDYRVEAKSLARDDRLDYDITLNATQLQPGAAREVEPPATLDFSIANDSLIDLTSFGDREMLGVLKDANGAVIEQLQGRADDWTLALARRLPAGAYHLELTELAAKPQSQSENAQEEETSDSEEGAAFDEASTQGAPDEDANDTGVEIRLALPAETSDGALALDGARTLTGNGAHVIALPAFAKGSLALVVAQSSSDVALTIERRDASGVWSVIGATRGLAPVAAWPVEDAGEHRAVVWSIGGAGADIALAARAVERRGRDPGEIALQPVAGLPVSVCAGLAQLPTASLVNIGANAVIVAGSTPGRLLQQTRAGVMAPQSERLWLLSEGDCKTPARVTPVKWAGEEIALDLGAFEHAEMPRTAAPSGKARLWLARSAFGRVGLDAGTGMALADGATLALAGDAPLRVWNAAGPQPLRLTLRALDVDVLADAKSGALFRGVIAPLTAQPLTMDGDGASLTLDLPPGVAVFDAGANAKNAAVFGDETPLAHIDNRAFAKLWLVNITDKPAPVRVALNPGKAETLAPGRAIKRFLGSAGEVVFPIAGDKGDRLITIGAAATFVSHSGRVTQGGDVVLDGPGDVTLRYSPGLVAVWLERAGKGPWPATTPRAIIAPQHVALEGEAMSFALRPEAAVMLDVTSSAPALLAFTQNGKRDLRAFPAGVAFHHYMSAGEATLEIYAPSDGALSGALDVTTQPIIAVHEGVNDAVTLAPGASALFAFETKRESEIGLGLRADPDRASARLMDINGKTIGEGVAQSLKLAPGRYLVEARAPADAPLSVVRLAIMGLTPSPAGPPDEVVAEFLEKAGLKKTKIR